MGEDNDIEMNDRFVGRDGHLTERAVNRLLAGELAGDERAFVEEHIFRCDACGARVEAVKKFDAGFAIAPSAAVRAAAGQADNVVSLEDRRRMRGMFGAVGLLVAAAAAVAIALNTSKEPAPSRVVPGEPDEEIRFKGLGLALEIFANDGQKTRALHQGDVVHPGERLGFRVSSREAGFLLVVGIDDTGQVYPVHPQDGSAAFVEAGSDKRDLESAIRLDDVGSSERIIAARCPATFTLPEIRDAVKGASTLRASPGEDRWSRCVYHETTLKKTPSK